MAQQEGGHNETTSSFVYKRETSFSLSRRTSKTKSGKRKLPTTKSCNQRQTITTKTTIGDQGSKTENLICTKPTSGGQRTENFMAPAIVTRSGNKQVASSGATMLPHNERSDDDLPLHRHHHHHHHHDNNNNNNDNNNGAASNGQAGPPIAPVVPERSRGSKQQIVGVPVATASEQVSQRRPQQPLPNRSQQQQQKSYHHYDYYTESDLTGSLPINSANHYEDNILLFATEHNSGSNSNHNIANNNNNNNGLVAQKKDANKQQRQVTQYLNGSSHKQQLANAFAPAPPSDAYAANRAARQNQTHLMQSSPGNVYSVGQTGKFVNYYPSWRQTQSPTTGHYHNYSFHVPLHLQTSAPSSRRQQRQYYQSRYSFVAPINAQEKPLPGNSRSGNNKQRPISFSRSRTISHLPNMVKISVEDTIINSKLKNLDDNDDDDDDDDDDDHDHDDQARSRYNHEDFYDRPYINETARQFIRSDGDLLKAHLVELRLPEEGYDNPFKPGTELSWEADMMVRLMKRGYPVQELPVLVQTAKQVARDKGSSRQLAAVDDDCQAIKKVPLKRMNFGSTSKEGPGKSSTWSHKMTWSSSGEHLEGKKSPAAEESDADSKIDSTSGIQKLVRRQSSNDLSSGKQIWANSLSRTKSMPRFCSPPTQQDADSIDKLIISIEQEMSELLKSGEDRQQVDYDVDSASRLIPREATMSKDKTISSSALTATKRPSGASATSGGSGKQRRKSSGQKEASVQSRLRKQSGRNGSRNELSNEATESNKTDLNRSKMKQKNKRCCIIQ